MTKILVQAKPDAAKSGNLIRLYRNYIGTVLDLARLRLPERVQVLGLEGYAGRLQLSVFVGCSLHTVCQGPDSCRRTDRIGRTISARLSGTMELLPDQGSQISAAQC